MFSFLCKTEKLTAQVVQPVKLVPPHCPYFAVVQPVVDPPGEVLVLAALDVFVLDEVPLEVVVTCEVEATLVGTAEPEYGGPVVVTVSIPEQVAPADLVVPPE